MRELDQLLERYLDTRYAGATEPDKAAFAELLERQDPELWDWLSGVGVAPVAAWQRIVDEMRLR